MAKVIYYLSPFDKEKKIELDTSESIQDILTELGIENLPLAVCINGRNPEEIDLNYRPTEDDLIEIIRPVDGNDSKSKGDLATLVTIATLVAVTVLTQGATSPWLVSAIAVGGSLVAGALNQRALELSLIDIAGGADSPEADTATNSYSITGVTNEARPLRPMPLLMGSHRYAPDIHCQPYRSVYNEENALGTGTPIYSGFYPGGSGSSGGQDASNTNWAVMPAGYIAKFFTGGNYAYFPKYQIKIATYHWGYPAGVDLTPAQNANVIDKVKNFFLSGGNFYNFGAQFGLGEFSPLIIYHSSGTDPYYLRYNFMEVMSRIWEVYKFDGVNWDDRMNYVFGGSTGAADAVYSDPAFTNSKNLINITGAPLNYYYFGITAADSIAASMLKVRDGLLDINGGSYSSPKGVSYLVTKYLLVPAISSVVKEGFQKSTQVFNYGIGDLTISERLIGSLSVDANDVAMAVYDPINHTDWTFAGVPYGFGYNYFYFDVLPITGKKLINVDSTENLIETFDMGQYNFTYFEGQPGLDAFGFTITGNLYATNTSTGFTSNYCRIEMQYKLASETTWKVHGLLEISNDNTKKLSYTSYIIIIPTVPGFEPTMNDPLQVRVRKVTLDSTNNTGSKICSLFIDDCKFYQSNNYTIRNNLNYKNAPMNLEGLYTTALVSDSAQTNKLSAFCESKCWVYDELLDTWTWQKTDNPAWWFLYFAKGGFLNLNSGGFYPHFAYPYSPTDGWVNYPGHPDNTEQIFGVGLTLDKIDLDKIKEWAVFCDDNELSFNMVLKEDISCADTLEKISNVGRGSVTYYNGLLSVVYEDPEVVPTCLFGMGNIKAGSFSVDYAVSDPVRKVTGAFVNKEDWEVKDLEALVPFSEDDNLKFVEVTLDGVTNEAQAQREVNLIAARQFYQRRVYSWSVDIEGLIAKRGDVVYLSHDSTQYGYSGRVKNFVVVAGVVTKIESSSILDSSITYITMREPDGNMHNYACTSEENFITFTDPYPINLASSYIDVDVTNDASDFPGSIPEDFVFIAGAKETPGKLVRISQITASEDMSFAITAVDEDPAMYAYEYDNEYIDEDLVSFEDSELALYVTNLQVEYPAKGLALLYWENVGGDFIQIINEANGLPLESSGAYSFTGGKVLLELTSNQKYTLIVKPFSIGAAFKSVNKRIEVWPT